MALPSLKDFSRAAVASVVAAGVMVAPMQGAFAQSSRPTVSRVAIPDAPTARPVAANTQMRVPTITKTMNAGADSARLVAGQGTQTKPSVLLLGGNQDSWPKVVRALEQAQSEGYPIEALVVGPTNVTPALEVYVRYKDTNGMRITKPIDPDSISEAQLTALMRDISQRFYPRTLAMQSATAPSAAHE